MRFRLAVFVVVSVLLLAAGPACAEVRPGNLNKANRYCQTAVRLLKAGKTDQAREKFEKALSLVPTFPIAHIGLGDLAMSEGRFEVALEEYTKARDGYADLGSMFYKLQARRFADARKEITSLRDGLNNPAGQGAIGFTSLRRSQIENRISQLESIDAPDKNQMNEPPGEIFFKIGNALFRLGRLDEARQAWQTCAEKSEKFALVHNNLALLYMQAGDYEAAKKELARAEELGFKVNPKFKADLEKRAGH